MASNKGKSSAKGGSKGSGAKSGSFGVMLDDSLDSYPEPQGLPEGPYRFGVKSTKVDKDGDVVKKVMLVLQAKEARGDQQVNGDLGGFDPVFQSYDYTRVQDVQMFKRLALAAGVDGKLKTEDAAKAMQGVELDGVVTRSPSKKDPNRLFTNVRQLSAAGAA